MMSFGPRWEMVDLPGTETPVDQRCEHCGEQIRKGDSGVLMNKVEPNKTTKVPFHRCCFLRGVFGSVGHQRGRCHCFGGTEEDPENMTVRQQAEAAVEYAMITRGRKEARA